MEIRTAILIDGAFYRYRAQSYWGEKTPKERGQELEWYCRRHIQDKNETKILYRVFYYDCPPSNKKIYHPYLKRQRDLSREPLYQWTKDFFEELKKKRKFALRLGILSDQNAQYSIYPKTVRELCAGRKTFDELTESDFKVVNLEQKCVDMMIGIDIASMAYKKQVDQMILIAGDSDFVPAAKCARREGIDFILDPMRTHVKKELYEHIDGIRTRCPKEIIRDAKENEDTDNKE